MRKTPFVVALNKIDRMYGWDEEPNAPFRKSLGTVFTIYCRYYPLPLRLSCLVATAVFFCRYYYLALSLLLSRRYYCHVASTVMSLLPSLPSLQNGKSSTLSKSLTLAITRPSNCSPKKVTLCTVHVHVQYSTL